MPLVHKGVLKRAPEMVVIEIDGQGSSDFTKELDAIFASSLAELTPSLRPYWQAYANEHFLNEASPAPAPKQGFSKIAGTIRPPHVITSVDPSFSDSARELRVSGSTLIALIVDEQGLPGQFKIVRPLGLGLDERAIAAISQYRFAPATNDGKPIKVELSIDVNFQIYHFL
jgi:TonB family protein